MGYVLILAPPKLFAQWPLKQAFEHQLRGGLPNFYKQLNQQQHARIGYLGGSITDGNYWRPRIESWLNERHPDADLEHVNLGIGGSNSKHAAYRIDQEVLKQQRFDLLFVEFAVNDYFYRTSSDIEKGMEAIVRKVWRTHPYTDICFVYTPQEPDLEDIRNGKMNLTASKHDSIASYYDIPAVFLGLACLEQIESDSVVFTDPNVDLSTGKNPEGLHVFMRDQKHPTIYGTEIYAERIAELLTLVEEPGQKRAHLLKAPTIHFNLEASDLQAVQESLNQGFQLISSDTQRPEWSAFVSENVHFLASENSQSNYRFEFTGNEIGINILTGPSVGIFEIVVDGTVYEFDAFDSYSQHWRPQYRFLELPYGDHQITIRPSTKRHSLEYKKDKLFGDFRKKHLEDNPELYDHNELVFSGIFLFDSLCPSYTKIVDSLRKCPLDSNLLYCYAPVPIEWNNGELKHSQFVQNPGNYSASYQINSVSKYSDTLQLQYLPEVEVTISQIPELCDSITNWTPPPASPAGGSYYLDGIYGESFDLTVLTSNAAILNYEIVDQGCTFSSQQTIYLVHCETISGINENPAFEKQLIYPNPINVGQELLISTTLGEDAIVYLINQTGRKVYSHQINGHSSIQIPPLAPGSYFLEIEQNTGSYRQTLIILNH